MTDDKEELLKWLAANGYSNIREINGELVGVTQMMFTGSIVIGMDRVGYRTRYCYPTIEDARKALETWTGEGDPPGPWIKQKPEERHGPGMSGEDHE